MNISLLEFTVEDLNKISDWIEKTQGYKISRRQAFCFAVHTSCYIVPDQEDFAGILKRKRMMPGKKTYVVSIDGDIEKKFNSIKKLAGKYFYDNSFLAAVIVQYRLATLPPVSRRRGTLVKRRSIPSKPDGERYSEKLINIMHQYIDLG